METVIGILNGFAALTDPSVFAYMVGGFLIGTFFGAVPGLTAVLAVALLLPLTFSLPTETALVMCASIFMAGMYSGSITATTINIPGAPSSMMTAVEGNPMMLRGEGSKALGHAAFGSMIGGVSGALLLMLIAPFAAKAALFVQTPGKFSLILFALVVIVIAQKKALSKGLAATVLGLMIATIGIDVMEPVPRFNFGFEALVAGIDMMPLIIGTFAISELLIQAENTKSGFGVNAKSLSMASAIRRRDFLPTRADLREIGALTYVKGAIIGYFTGVLPGAGGSMAAFVSYAEAMRSSKNPEKYGKGSIQGIAAAESANNSMCGGAFVPMLTFGIPGDPTTAVVLGVLIINGLQPGPQLMTTQFHLVAPMFAALFISALILIPLTLFIFGPYFIKIVSIRKAFLYPAIAVVALVGGYVATFSIFQMMLSLVFGVIAYFLRKENFPTVSLLLGFLLGPNLEQFFRRSLSLSDGDPSIFLTSPDSLFFLILTVIFFYFMVIRKPKKPAEALPTGDET